jgi:hypothetical protein
MASAGPGMTGAGPRMRDDERDLAKTAKERACGILELPVT